MRWSQLLSDDEGLLLALGGARVGEEHDKQFRCSSRVQTDNEALSNTP